MTATELARHQADGETCIIGLHGNLSDVTGEPRRVAELGCWFVPTEHGLLAFLDSEAFDVRVHCCHECRGGLR